MENIQDIYNLIQATTSSRRRLIAVLTLVLVSLAWNFPSQSSGSTIDLSSPEATIRTYCQAVREADVSVVRQCFYLGAQLQEGSFKKPIWTDCKIVELYETKEIGRYLGEGVKLFTQAGDVEVVQEVSMIDPAKGNPKTRFWYLLRKFDGNWRIISHSHIPDKNYPALD